ncbi:hypothetical protein P7K49_005872 [Saguinus oedipus]|uniref:Uncharacterized protein n=1 Tax=Saguinus oedipus TaxID=9490 RepID=A0ABQ9W0S4_SAGOE|nr:hypothetical protein P7K49_005872 [Saguinus oedipus]
MVCETKIVAAEDHEALPGAKKDALLAAAGAMWPPLPAAPGPAAAPPAPPPAPAAQPRGGAGGAGPPGGRGVCIREFRAAEQEAARRIFYDGIMERIPNTAFRGLRQHPRAQLLYALLAGQCAGPPPAAVPRAGAEPPRPGVLPGTGLGSPHFLPHRAPLRGLARGLGTGAGPRAGGSQGGSGVPTSVPVAQPPSPILSPVPSWHPGWGRLPWQVAPARLGPGECLNIIRGRGRPPPAPC